ncbi:hypothetical protein Forpi1262_v017968 [Fusarium oxysporum f. sp. raphani]|uniref:Uncharacterized protein n=1 Tax=Fusarium oxysporum f. sp. raphani TaxID=96318 RepID=A0A8J5NT19_FUSOX|nr:hypothetical protein Forpi1262_v017968 [Fusarium oxysporum f. sp. raphani]
MPPRPIPYRPDKESPVVVAVSQLDRRYFNGSTANTPSVLVFAFTMTPTQGFVELPKLIPGTYTICTRVDAERDTSLESVEDVIKQECRARTENVKLAQVGFAYDVAHKKAEAYISEASRLDKIKDRERASKCRREERRRRWEERHIKRVLTKKQKQKDKNKQRTRCKAQKEIDSASNKEPLTSAQTVAGPLTKNTNADVEGTRGCTLPGDVEKGTAQQEIIVQRHAEDGKVIRVVGKACVSDDVFTRR